MIYVQVHGTLRVVMSPLIDKVPIIGALSVFFISQPVSIHVNIHIFVIYYKFRTVICSINLSFTQMIFFVNIECICFIVVSIYSEVSY